MEKTKITFEQGHHLLVSHTLDDVNTRLAAGAAHLRRVDGREVLVRADRVSYLESHPG